jgi:ketosteroid isomerase-like protein
MTDEQAAAEVGALLQEMAARYGAKDVDGVIATFGAEDTVIVGTGADEVRFGAAETRAQVARDMAQSDDLSFGIDNLRVDVFGDAAFTYADVTFSGSAGGESFKIPARWTSGLARTGDGWRIVQFHVSVPYAEQAEGESFPG